MTPPLCPIRLPAACITKAVKCLKAGGVVAYPTETYYGLGVDPFNEKAVERLFIIKKRPTAKPILTLISHREELHLLAESIPAQFIPLIRCFWPGPLTLLFPALATLPALLTGKSGTIGIRISSHPHARQLLTAYGGPLTATSANISGLTPANSSSAVAEYLGAGVDYILEGGETPGGMGSTIVAAQDDTLTLVRKGAIEHAILPIPTKETPIPHFPVMIE